MTKNSNWIPVLLPKDVVKQLLREYIVPTKAQTQHMEILKDLQRKAKEVKLFSGMSKQQIIRKLHQLRKKLLKENPHAYIDYTA